VSSDKRRRRAVYAYTEDFYLKSFPVRMCICVAVLIGTSNVLLLAQESTESQKAKQQAAETGAPRGQDPVESSPKRIFGIIPNYRTSPSLAEYVPLTTRQKFKIASQDSFDRGTFILGAAFGGESDLTRSNPSFGDGVPAYAKYFAYSYADFAIGDFMTEAIFPSMLHQDPRYFRKGNGGVMSRMGYATGQLFWTHNDSGRSAFNFSEVGGNAAAVAISNVYYPEGRDASDAIVKLGTQLAVDLGSNILKEFSPDIYRKFGRKHARK
jgi:hypothetical protein